MMAQNWAENTREITNYGRFINQFPPNIIRSIGQFERINKKICKQKISIMFNQICINEEMLPKYIYKYMYYYLHKYIYIYIHIHTHHIYAYEYMIYIYIFFHHTTYESTCDTISSSAAIQG